ncbi:hypothetical protein Hanom_Chr17g01559961 [Helianthus anomalus]
MLRCFIMIHKTHEPEILTVNRRDLDIFVCLLFTWYRNWVHRGYLLQWDNNLCIAASLSEFIGV